MKAVPEGAAPLFNPEKDKVITTFEELFNKIKEVRDESIILQPQIYADEGFGDIADVRSSREQGQPNQGGKGPSTISDRPTRTTDGGKRGGLRQSGDRSEGGTRTNLSQRQDLQGDGGNISGQRTLPEDNESKTSGDRSGRIDDRGRSEGDIRRSYDMADNPTIARDELALANLPYKPVSKGQSLGLIIPKNMAFEARKQLLKLEEEVGGDIDQYVVDKKGY